MCYNAVKSSLDRRRADGAMGKRIAEMTVEELRKLIEEIVEQKLGQLLSDPDFGLELREEVVERLRKSQEAVKRGTRGKPLDEVAKDFGLE